MTVVSTGAAGTAGVVDRVTGAEAAALVLPALCGRGTELGMTSVPIGESQISHLGIEGWLRKVHVGQGISGPELFGAALDSSGADDGALEEAVAGLVGADVVPLEAVALKSLLTPHN